MEAVKEPFEPRLGTPVPLAVQYQREQSMTWVSGVCDQFFLVLPLTLPSVYRSRMAGSLAPVMYWAIRTTLCSALWSEAEQLPYPVVMQLVRMLSMVQL